MYHYTESGLRNIWLANGYREIDTPDGIAFAIEDIESLHKAVGRHLLSKKKLTGTEFRFLRKELGLSQTIAGQYLGVSDQTVAKWEKEGRISAPAERLMRLLYEEAKLNSHPKIKELLETINDLDRSQKGRIRFKQAGGKWRLAA
ncbi:MAG: helix-turn-helix domain-containing protein [Proteobacteria bacterium]|nr:helix-turn-helix domain-containing protein [Pseudomonadota bacterium]MCL2308483.1 helix-turn-helix domain-containing protein [Pseudomonadota bacterium]